MMFVAVLSDKPELREKFCASVGKEISKGELALYSAGNTTLIDPVAYPEKIQPLLYSLSMADYFVLLVETPTPKIGELIVALNSVKADKGLIVSPAPLPLGGTTLEKFEKVADVEAAKSKVASLQPPAASGENLLCIVHSVENVKSLGNVAHGLVKSGKLKKADKLFILPEKKDLEVRHLMHGESEVEEASAGMRFSMAYKGDAFDRGLVVPLRNEFEPATVINGRFIRSPFYKDELKGKIHAYSNMQYVEGHINENDLTLSAPLAYEKGELILVVDASNQKLRIAGAFQSKW